MKMQEMCRFFKSIVKMSNGKHNENVLEENYIRANPKIAEMQRIQK